MAFPDGYNTLVGEKGVTLSGGQKQRVTIARTLLKNPRILILDDSTSSVDTETEAEIRQALNELMENRTTFIIAHRIQSVMNADLILVMDKGEIVQMGRHEELVSNKDGMYRRIYDIQTRIDEELEDGNLSCELIYPFGSDTQSLPKNWRIQHERRINRTRRRRTYQPTDQPRSSSASWAC